VAVELFIEKKFSAAHKHVIKQANQIIEEYLAAGYTLTLRQIHYQFVARDYYENNQQNYKRLGKILDAARKAGRIDWDAIEDRTRFVRKVPTWDRPEDIIRSAAEQFKLDPWDLQPVKRRIEVWIEKDALVGVIEPVCNDLRIPYFSCRGYGSSSEIYSAGKRLAAYRRAGYEVMVLHLGDHDPSGVQMSEDNENRLGLFAHGDVPFRRIALNMDQIQAMPDLPPNFAKETDSRQKWYIDKFGTDDAWELDALTPQFIDRLIRDEVEPLIDRKVWEETMAEEQTHLKTFSEMISDWSAVKAAPAMRDKLREFATEYEVSGAQTDDGYESDDSGTLAMFIDESAEVLRDNGLL